MNDLYKLSDTFKELKKSGVIKHLKKCFCFAIAQNKSNILDLATAIKNTPNHVYNHHENCVEWCKRDNKGSRQIITLLDQSLYNHLKQVIFKYTNNAFKFSVAASSQANESLNSIIISKAPKVICYSKTESCDYRVANAVLSKNEGDIGLINIKEKLGLVPTKHSINYYMKCDKLRKYKSS